ncbi:MAG TPA: ABC transporter permease subunit, partial [Spirochaetia bacterium]|nr:ABC transporter permease subunit [Spirochaetia bacterium]
MKRATSYHLMLAPSVLFVLVFSYGPMVGIVIAFQKFNPVQGFFHSPWLGLDNFRYVALLPDAFQVLWNTIFIAFMKIVIGFAVPIVVALLLNETRSAGFKRTIQTVVYLPHFLSWVILSGIIIDILSPSSGIVNTLLKATGRPPIFFLGNEHWFPWVLIFSDVWKEFGFGTVIFLAAIAGVNPVLYEAAVIDGATRMQQLLHVTLPGIVS